MNKHYAKVMNLSSEGRHRSPADMWNARSNQDFIPRLGKTMLGALVGSRYGRRAVLGSLGAALSIEGKPMSNGCEQAVYSTGDTVTKVFLGSLGATAEEAAAKARQMQSDFDACVPHMADIWLPTTYDVHRSARIGSVVVARQELLYPDTDFLSSGDILEWAEASDENRASVRSFGERALQLQAATGLMPDVCGIYNVAAISSRDQLVMMDTIPVPPETQAKPMPALDNPERSIGQYLQAQFEAMAAA